MCIFFSSTLRTAVHPFFAKAIAEALAGVFHNTFAVSAAMPVTAHRAHRAILINVFAHSTPPSYLRSPKTRTGDQTVLPIQSPDPEGLPSECKYRTESHRETVLGAVVPSNVSAPLPTSKIWCRYSSESTETCRLFSLYSLTRSALRALQAAVMRRL